MDSLQTLVVGKGLGTLSQIYGRTTVLKSWADWWLANTSLFIIVALFVFVFGLMYFDGQMRAIRVTAAQAVRETDARWRKPPLRVTEDSRPHPEDNR